MIKYGYLATTLTGGVALMIGSLFLVLLTPELGPIWAAVGAFLIGVGMGLTNTTFVVAIQSSVDWNLRGAATSALMFTRMLGNTVGAALMGGILNSRLSGFLPRRYTA